MAEERQRLVQAKADPENFRWFFDRYRGRLRSFLLGLVHDPEVADDLRGRVFQRALMGLARYKWQGRLYGAYLHRIAVNEARSYWREQRRRQYVNLDAGGLLVDPRPDVLRDLITAEEALSLRAAIARLSEAEQIALGMYYWEGLSTVEIAAGLSQPQGTVQARLKRARDKLQAALSPEEQPAATRAETPVDRLRCLADMLRRLGRERDSG